MHSLLDETSSASGMDIRANLASDIVLEPLERATLNTGLFMELPIGFEAQIRPRSGLAAKRGITLLNAPGTIDADYRGEIKVIMINLSDESQMIQDGDRIAQMVISKYERVDWDEVVELAQTERSDGGFGHTGIK